MRRLITMLLVAAAPLAAQSTHPDFSGKWTLDPAKSGGQMMATSVTSTITQTDKAVKVEQKAETPMGPQSATLTYNLDGSPSKNSVTAQGGSIDLNSTAGWKGDTLTIATTAEVQGMQLQQNDKWTLSDGGKTLTISSDISMAGQSMNRKQVFTKP
jgi:hypothetical protein